MVQMYFSIPQVTLAVQENYMQHAEGLMETWEAETPVENRNSGSFYYYP
jgi:hypothetical protein